MRAQRVVEDEYLLADILADALTDLGAEVVGPIGQPAQAIALIETTPVDGAVLDINLRGEMVYPLAGMLTNFGAPYVFATGYEQDSIPTRYEDVTILIKPVDV